MPNSVMETPRMSKLEKVGQLFITVYTFTMYVKKDPFRPSKQISAFKQTPIKSVCNTRNMYMTQNLSLIFALQS
jgi:hypothetical protein